MLLLAIEKAVTPSEGLEALTTLQAMLVGDPVAQVKAVCFLYSHIYTRVPDDNM